MKYRINILGCDVTLTVKERDGNPDEHELLLNYGAAYGFELFDIGRKRTDGVLVSLLLSACFGSFRGYPECTVDIMLEGGRKSINILPSEKGRVTIKPDKCKVLCTKMHKFSDLIELPLITAEAGGAKIRVARVENAECFSKDRLSLLRALPEMPVTDGAFAISGEVNDRITAVGDSSAPSLYLALFSYLATLGDFVAVTEEGEIEISDNRVFLPVSVQCLS